MRQVVVFRLQPVGDVPVELPPLPVPPPTTPTVEPVPVEEQHTERAHVTPDREPYEAERRDAALVHRYRVHLQQRGHVVNRLQVFPAGESRLL